MSETLYKVTDKDGAAYHGGKGKWPLPNGKAGKWLTVKGDLVPCENGLHLCRANHLINWLGPVIWEAEYDGELIEVEDKIVVRKARLLRHCGGWTEQTARLFAADCTERVLHLAKDPRCDAAVKASRQYAFGLIDDAAWDAARDAARAATWDAARAAEWAAGDAAWDAARAAAWAAARAAAKAAARAAAKAAARAAAWDAAWDAEEKWQSERLLSYLTGAVDLNAIKQSVS